MVPARPNTTVLPRPSPALLGQGLTPTRLGTAVDHSKYDPADPGYGDSFVNEPSEEDERTRARAVNFGNVPAVGSSEGSEVGNEDSRKTVHGTGRTNRLRSTIKRTLIHCRRNVEEGSKKLKAVKRSTFCRTYRRVKRSVKNTRLYKNLLVKTVSSTSIREPALGYRPWHVSTVSIAGGEILQPHSYRPWTNVQYSRRGSRVSLGHLSVAEPETPSSQPVRSRSSDAVRVGDKVVDQAAVIDDLAAVISTRRASESSYEIETVSDQFRRHTETYTAKLEDRTWMKSTSISAQITAFRFSSLVPMHIVSKFAPTHRVCIETSNDIMVRTDMVQLSHIWSQLVKPAPILRTLELNNPLRILEEAKAEMICSLVEECVHRCAHWAIAVATSANTRAGAMSDEWWHNFEAQLDAIGNPDEGLIARQLIVVGRKYVNVTALESVITALEAFDTGKIFAGLARHDSKTGFEEATIINSAPVSEQKAKRPVTAGPGPQPAAQLRRWSTVPAVRKETNEDLVLPSRSLRLGKDIAIPSEGNEEDAHARAKDTSLSSDILRELSAVLDAAVNRTTVLSPEPMGREDPHVPLPLTIRKSPSLLPKPKVFTIRRTPPTQAQWPENAGRKETGWSAAIDLPGCEPKDVKYPGPPELSNKAKGKLLVTRTGWPRTSITAPRSTSKITEPQVTPHRTVSIVSAPKASLSKAAPSSAVVNSTSTEPRMLPQTQVTKQAASAFGPSRHTVTRAERSMVAGRSSGQIVSANLKTSQMRLRSKAMYPSSVPKKSESLETTASQSLSAATAPHAEAGSRSSSRPLNGCDGQMEPPRILPTPAVHVTSVRSPSLQISNLPLPRRKITSKALPA
ncbi:hypothetical protein C7974DRAFT_34542 [Boeremia exigua]|uniref:uncharacterized protein n=1 Tax=Boeremia exigua TaxID=749465 RepID=UPI001E8E3F3E|nr:uncharacterized protein C7974DRAFT_34542 [Boeremia exigua]KAH6618671.1 hypothetical protein C7974DRAFT_34542 [Boeremia exigua]